jgi:hypothetical protein
MGTPNLRGSRINEFLWKSLRTLGLVALLVFSWGSVYWLALIKNAINR